MNSEYSLLGKVVLGDEIIENGAVVVSNGVIEYSGHISDAPRLLCPYDIDGIIGPGFVDIHCHAGGDFYAYEDPAKMAFHHLKHGTTSLLCTFYRHLSHEQLLECINMIKDEMTRSSNIVGVHLEGPYLNPMYGSGEAVERPILRSEYMQYINSGIIRQWTYAPELDGTKELLSDMCAAGIVPAIGHSAASPEDVKYAAEHGARIVTHLYDATGYSVSPTRCAGTIEVSFNTAALIQDNLYYEIICDKEGMHVRPELVRLTVKAVGAERIVGITDACTGGDDGNDLNFVNGELTGSKMTMDRVARNFLALGFSVPEVFKITSLNPSRAIRMESTIGSLDAGKCADILITDSEFNIKKIIKAGIAV